MYVRRLLRALMCAILLCRNARQRTGPLRFKIYNDFSWTFVWTLYGLKPQNMSIHPIGILVFKYFRLLEAF